MTNNFELFKEYIRITNPTFPQSNKKALNDFFYEISLISRGKDNSDKAAANYIYNSFKIFCWDDFDLFIPDIIKVCDLLKLRAYITINKKSVKQIALNTIASMASRAAQGDFKKIYKEWDSNTGSYKCPNDNFWIIDLDNIEKSKIQEFKDLLYKCKTTYSNLIISEIPTRSGFHLITRPFNRNDLAILMMNGELNILPEVSIISRVFSFKNPMTKEAALNWINCYLIHENHLTLLYENL